MFFYEGCTCPVCGQLFKETDDIVACPECGAPHHRACWKQEGHCHFQDTHGTAQQWSRPAAPAADGGSAPAAAGGKRCPNCGQSNPEFAEFCSHCGRELSASDWSSAPPPPPPQGGYVPPYPPPGAGNYGEYMPFHMPVVDPCGGVPKEERICGVTAEDMAYVTGNNSAYYVPRFQRMDKTGSKISWNWPAFLLTPYWLLFRKNYLAGALVLVFNLLSSLLNAYVYNPLLSQASTMADLYRQVEAAMEDGSFMLYFWMITLIFVVDLLIRIFFGLTANYWYMRACASRVKKMRQKKPDLYPQELTAAGGTSFLLGASAYAILYFASMLISVLLF